MGTKKSRRPSAAIKDSSKHSSHRDRSPIKSQMHQRRIISKKKAKMSLRSKGAKTPRFKPLAKLFRRGGMAYGSRSILHTINHDDKLRRKFLRRGIRSKKGVEEALLELLFQCRNLKDWDSGGDNLVDVFRLIKGRVKWAADCSVDLIMQLFFALLRARLDCPVNMREIPCKVALRVDKVISYINGVDHLLAEYEIYTNLVLPIHHAMRSLPKKAKIPPSVIPGAVFLQTIGGSSN